MTDGGFWPSVPLSRAKKKNDDKWRSEEGKSVTLFETPSHHTVPGTVHGREDVWSRQTPRNLDFQMILSLWLVTVRGFFRVVPLAGFHVLQ
jgi:hypothetical protein